MKAFINLKDDYWIRSLGHKCLDKCMQNYNHLISKMSLLSIIFENFDELSENHPAFIASTLSTIGFVVPTTLVDPKSTASHLSSYGRYDHLSKTWYLDILICNIWVRWTSFQKKFDVYFQNFQNKYPYFRNYIVKPAIALYYAGHSTTILAIPLPNFVFYQKDHNPWLELLLPNPNPFTYYPSYSTDPNDPWNLATTYNTVDSNGTIEENSSLIEPPTATTNMFMLMGSAITAVYIMLTDKWTGYKKPYISSNLREVLHLPEEEPTLKQIEGAIKDLSKIQSEIKELKTSIQSIKAT
ncbi:13218_t:CDS:2 [Dentiscutata heterogama]|uniref:13218_t:CDS:1 n=1 Tax=Dentiscutata heterogama TaxID=1316150 RepID=A0ACA9K4M4_9GLOM|nr:13218_t:CDS:2 [Dentiscutata heterogama]